MKHASLTENEEGTAPPMEKQRLALEEAPESKPAESDAEAPAEPAEPTTPRTAEELQQQAKNIYEVMFGGEMPEEPKPPKQEDSPEPEPTPAPPAAEAPVTEPPAPEKKPVEAKAPEPEPEPEPEPMSTEQIIARTARETADAIAAKPEPQPENEPQMEDADAEDYKAIQFMETQNPKHSGLADKFAQFVRSHYAYREKWLTENPGKEYDPDDDEHVAWNEKHQPEIDIKALDRAKMSMAVEEQVEKRLAPRLQQLDADKAWEAAKPTIQANLERGLLELVDIVSPEMGKIIKDKDGKPQLNEQTLAAMEESDPVAKPILDVVVKTQLYPLLLELERSVTVPGYRLSPSTNALHRDIDTYRQKLEADMSSAPANVRTDAKGRKWITTADFTARHNAIENGRGAPAQKQAQLTQLQNSHFTLTVDDLSRMIVHDVGVKAKLLIEEIDKLGAKKYKKAQSPAQQEAPKPATAQAEKPAPSQEKPSPPAVPSQSDSMATKQSPVSGEKTRGDKAVDAWFS